MSFKDDFNLFIGADYGIFKGCKAFHGQSLVKSIQSINHLSKETNVTAMTWGDDKEEDILIGLSNQVVKTYDTKGKAFSFSTDAKVVPKDGAAPSSGSICGLTRFDGALVTATESGHIRVMRYNEDECININAGQNLCKMRHSKTNPNIIGSGGLENELKLWDLNTGKNTFLAKNVPNDQRLQTRVKVWVTDHTFLPNSQKVVVGSRYGYVRLYDPKAQRKPVVNINVPDQAISCIAASNSDDSVLCGLAKGDIVKFDMRNGKASAHYKGFYGAVSAIACHPTEPYIASVSHDRFLRVHHLTTKELVLKEFMVTRMNCVLMRTSFSLDPTIKAEPEQEKRGSKRVASDDLLSDGQSDNEDQLEELFNAMEEVPDEPCKKSRKVDLNTPLKKASSQLVVNPFSNKKTSRPKKANDSVKETIDNDSDDDIMIVSESIGNAPAVPDQEGDESEPDEADGESDEFGDDDEDDEEENDDEEESDDDEEEDSDDDK
ncbi:hypothetical protein ONE63_009164 [Megalurothrips usitatus]|uniref:WD repeat-containing protein 74 n=1 Tax=Megalurothrips usitatus TaxID=439358 RepID=A0AAV7XIT5_9NEOP|nr:hypothetical protein ONE63_009164 [Megalurothrips usitatus]